MQGNFVSSLARVHSTLQSVSLPTDNDPLAASGSNLDGVAYPT